MGYLILKDTGLFGGNKKAGDYIASPSKLQARKAKENPEYVVSVSDRAYYAMLELLKPKPIKKEVINESS